MATPVAQGEPYPTLPLPSLGELDAAENDEIERIRKQLAWQTTYRALIIEYRKQKRVKINKID